MGYMDSKIWGLHGGLRDNLLVSLMLLQGGLCFAAAQGVAQDGATHDDAAPDGAQSLTVSSGSAFRVEVMHRTRLRKGGTVEGLLLEPIYSENRLLIPSGALLEGTISEVRPAAHGKRLEAKFHGDFTPLKEPIIQWTSLSRNDGSHYALLAESAAGIGSTLYFRSAHVATHQSMFRRGWNTLIGHKDSTLSTVKAPHKWERLQRFFWSQMPFHPQYVEENAKYEMALTQDLQLPAGPSPTISNSISSEGVSSDTPTGEQKLLEQLVSVHSRLLTDLNSAHAKAGDPVEAIVTQPVLDGNNELIIPQNSILHGKVLHAAASRRWGHDGNLRFSFNELTLPSGFQQNIEATPTAIESSPDARMQIDSEGGVAPQIDRSIAVPFVMGLLSAQALGNDDGALGSRAVASNGFALIGRLVAIGISSRWVGGSIGLIGTARSVYTRWLAHGKDTHFGHDTEIMLEMSPAHARRMAPIH